MRRIDGLQYIKNTAGGATPADFKDDWAPVGDMEWGLILKEGLVEVRKNGAIYLTEAGEAKLKELHDLLDRRS